MIREKKAVTAIEYGMLLSLIAAIVIVPVTSTGTSLQQIFCQMSGVIGGAACPDAAAAQTPGAGDVPLNGMNPLPAGTTCVNEASSESQGPGYLRVCTQPSGALYSVAQINYSSGGFLSEEMWTAGQGIGLAVTPSASGYTATIEGQPATQDPAYYTSNNFFYYSSAALADMGRTLSQMTGSYTSNDQSASSISIGGQNPAAAFILGLTPDTTESGAPIGVNSGGGIISQVYASSPTANQVVSPP